MFVERVPISVYLNRQYTNLVNASGTADNQPVYDSRWRYSSIL